ncbi:MAG: hypothetical protein K6A94_01040 [Bacteroidales bacterium]|nr:hypothetical protein [Bacteroidales bacterium]
MRKVRIIDENDPNYGKEYDGFLCFYDRLYGKKIDGKIQDLYCVEVEGKKRYYLTYQVDVDYYKQQEDDEYRAKHGYGIGDEVRVLDYEEVSCMSGDFKKEDTHVIKKISYDCGLVYFANDITCIRWPQVEVIKRAERKEARNENH